MKKSYASAPVLVAGAAIMALAIGTFAYVRSGSGSGMNPAPIARPNEVRPQAVPAAPPEILPQNPPATAETDGKGAVRAATIYRVVSSEDGLALEPRSIRLTGAAEPALTALNAMAALKDSPLPQGTQAQSFTLAPDGTATIDFNRAFVDNFSGGDTREAITLDAILATAGQFGAKQVQFTVEKKKIKSLGGTQSLTDPQPVPQTVGVAAPTAGQTAQSGGQ